MDLQSRFQRQRYWDGLFVGATRVSAALVPTVLGGMLLSLIVGAWPSISTFGTAFFTTQTWDTVSGDYGALAPVYGTLVTSGIALLIAVPVSFGIAVFLTGLCPTFLRRPLGICVELLAGIPSIIYGMWGLFVFAPFFSEHIQPRMTEWFGDVPWIGSMFHGVPMGLGLLTASLILAVMIIPYISSVMRDVFDLTPNLLKESAYGLGATTWEVVHHVVLPYAKSGVVSGIILGLGRALGETMAVTFVIGNTFNIGDGLYQSGVSITSALANEFAEASNPMHLASLLYLGLILFAITFVVLCLSKLMLLHMKKHEGKTV